MANNPAVRKVLESRGLKIPGDTHFVAAQHDTTRNDVRIVDLEDVPATHRKDLVRLLDDLREAGEQAAHERGLALEGTVASSKRKDSLIRASREVWTGPRCVRSGGCRKIICSSSGGETSRDP